MKLNLRLITVAASLLLVATTDVQGRPSRQHSVKGVIDVVNCASRSFTLKPKGGAAPLTFMWNDSTRFTKKGGCGKNSLDSGQTIHMSYRREVGQNVLREVSTKGALAACGAVCK